MGPQNQHKENQKYGIKYKNNSLDSENRENNKIIINGVNMIDCITGVQFEWNAGDIPKYSIEFAKRI